MTTALLWLLPSLAFASEGVDVLKLPPTARAMSLGGVGTLTAGSEALFYNPSGIGSAARPGLTLTHAQLYEGTRLDALGLVHPFSDGWGSLGVSFLALTQSALETRDMQGNPGGSFGASDLVVGLSWGRWFSDAGIQPGLTVKYIRQTIADSQATAFAADLGIQAGGIRSGLPLELGLSAQNLGPKTAFSDESFQLPLSFNGAIRYTHRQAASLLLGIGHRPYAKRTSIGIGMELALGQTMTLRSGYFNLMSGGKYGQESALEASSVLSSLGFGMGWRPLSQKISLDYAFAPGASQLGNTHRLTLGLEWGQVKRESARSIRRQINFVGY